MSEPVLRLKCPSCEKTLKIPESFRGKAIRCPACQKGIRIPAAKPNASPQPPIASAPTAQARVSTPPGHAEANASAKPQPQKPQQQQQKPKPVPSAPVDDFDWGEMPALGSRPPGSELPDAAKSTQPASFDCDNPFADLELPPAISVPARAVPRPAAAVPGGSAASVATTASGGQPQAAKFDFRKAIHNQLAEPIKMQRASIGYRAGLGLLSLFLMAMPLAYVVLVALSSWAVYYYTFTVFPDLLGSVRIRGGRVMILIYMAMVAPIIAGITVVIFMIKPIFFSLVSFGPTRTRALTREGEPLLFELVDHICDAIKAPKPKRIEVDSEVNASASYGAGFKAIFSGKLVLTIGVPLVAGLSTRQFAGVLAHEFGHFSQGAGMRAQLIIGAINLWFVKVVYARDALDEMLDEAIEDSESAFVFVLLLARGCVGLVRWILWGFMLAAHAASSIFSRQMEFDADRYQIALVGSEVFVSTSHEIHRLGHAYGQSIQGLVSLLQKATLIDNVPKMVQVCRNKMNQDDLNKIEKSLVEEKTGLFDTHPCTRERTDFAKRVAMPGVFTVDRPARELFQHYDALCNNVTLDFYRNAIGRLVDPNELKPVDQHLHVLMQSK